MLCVCAESHILPSKLLIQYETIGAVPLLGGSAQCEMRISKASLLSDVMFETTPMCSCDRNTQKPLSHMQPMHQSENHCH